MKKSTIWILSIVMALTFGGLLWVQIVYLDNMLRMRNDQFAEGVKRSLYSTVTRLEQDETRYYLQEDMARLQTQASGRGSVTSSFTTSDGIKGDITLKLPGAGKRYSSAGITEETLRGLYLYQQGLLDDVVLKIISKSSGRPIAERADSATVTSYLTSEFASNGIELPFEMAVVNRMGARIYATEGFDPAAADGGMFVQTLFPNDARARMNYIKVYFPAKSDYILSSVKFMLPSFLFLLILMAVFVYTIVIAFRQKKLSEMKNDFINNMTHEFKTPLSTISLAAQMLSDPAVMKSEKMLRHTSEVISDETKRLRFQVEKVLHMSMFDRQRGTLRFAEIDANVLLAGVVKTFKLKVEKFGGTIETRLDAKNALVNVDEVHFTNVIFNLLDNAVKYRDERRPLHLIVASRDHGRRLAISIEDNGIGIRRDDQRKVFERFYRVSTGNRHDVKGFGLGLAYVKTIIDNHGGEISLESEPGRGTKFTIYLPLTTP